MKLNWRVHRLSSHTPLGSAFQQNTFRDVIYLQLSLSANSIGYGEVAPLPQWGTESIDDALSMLPTISQHFTSTQTISSNQHARAFLQSFQSQFHSYKATRFAIEYATLCAVSQHLNCTLSDLLDLPKRDSVRVSRLIVGGKLDQLVNQIESKLHDSVTTYKWKPIGRVEDVLITYRELVQRFPNIVWRIDPNRSWTLSETVRFLEQCDTSRLDYLEEPLHATSHVEMEQLANMFRGKIALDESVSEAANANMQRLDTRFVYILKPAVAGLFQSIEWMRTARQSGARLILSSAMDSSFNAHVYQMLAAGTDFDEVHGIATAECWSSEPVIPRIQISQGRLKYPSSLAFGTSCEQVFANG